MINIMRDGNCLFRALSQCIYNNQNYYSYMRKIIVTNIIQNWYFYEPYIIGFYNKNLKEYEVYMNSDTIYGGYIELISASQIFKMYKFYVKIQNYNNTIQIGNGCVEKFLLFSGDLNKGHFDVLEKKISIKNLIIIGSSLFLMFLK